MNAELKDFDSVFVDCSSGSKRLKKEDIFDSGDIPVIDQGQKPIAGYTNDTDALCNVELPAVIFGDHTRAFKYVDFPFAVGADGVKVLRPRNGDDEKFLFYQCLSTDIEDNGYSRHFKFLKKKSFFIPEDKKEQKRIAAILDQADALRQSRRRAITRLNDLSQSIFYEMFGDPRTNLKGLPVEELGQIIKVGSGDGLTAENQNGGDYPVYGGNGVNGWHDAYNVERDTIVIGRVGVYCGAVHVTDRKAWVTDNALIVKLKRDMNISYLSSALKYANLNQYAGRSSQPLVSGTRIYPVKIMVPDMNLQNQYEQRITKIKELDYIFNNDRDKIENLFLSLQQRAFRGEL